MFNNITELLGTNTAMVTAVTLAAGTYLLNMVKKVPLSLLNMVIVKLTKSVYITSDNFLIYTMVEDAIYREYEDIFKNHISGVKNRVRGMDRSIYSIAPGVYTKIDWKTLSIINISKVELNTTNYAAGMNGQAGAQLFKLGLSTYGFGSSTVLDKFRDMIERCNKGLVYDTNKYIRVLEFGNDFDSTPIKFAVKKDRNNIYDEGVLNKIDKHIDKFLSNEKLYNKIGDTYKTGIILHGKPGTGKSCIAKYIAGKVNGTVINVGGSYGRKIIPTCDNFVPNNEMIVVLIEEIDKLITRNRSYDEGYVTYGAEDKKEDDINEYVVSSLLQSMDGITTPNRCIFVATTNHIEKLPEALIRKGRFDLKVEMNGITKQDAINMCNAFGANPDEILGEPDENGLYNPSELRNDLLLHSYK